MGKITGFMEFERIEEGYKPVTERKAKLALAATESTQAVAAT